MAFKSTITKEAESEIKKENKGNNTMKKAKIITLTVLITLATLAAIGGIFYAGFTLGQGFEKDITSRIDSEVNVLSAQTETPVEPSK